jgi:hypothetical protein
MAQELQTTDQTRGTGAGQSTSLLIAQSGFETRRLLKQATAGHYESLPLPSPETVSELTRIKEVLLAENPPCRRSDIAAFSALLLQKYQGNHNIGVGSSDPDAAMDKFDADLAHELRGVPRTVLRELLDRVTANSPSFMPTTPKIRAVALAMPSVRKVQATLFDINRILERAK